MAISNRKETFHCEVQKVWDVVTSLTEYGWRSDIDKIEVLSETDFVEYTKDGYATTFTITAAEPWHRWEFDMENDNIKGHWIGLFFQENGKTTVDFTEDVTAKKAWMKPFVKGYLRKQQERYMEDLKKVLGC